MSNFNLNSSLFLCIITGLIKLIWSSRRWLNNLQLAKGSIAPATWAQKGSFEYDKLFYFAQMAILILEINEKENDQK